MTVRLLTVAEVAEHLAITPAAVYQLVHRRAIPYRKLGTARKAALRFHPAELDAWTQPA